MLFHKNSQINDIKVRKLIDFKKGSFIKINIQTSCRHNFLSIRYDKHFLLSLFFVIIQQPRTRLQILKWQVWIVKRASPWKESWYFALNKNKWQLYTKRCTNSFKLHPVNEAWAWWRQHDRNCQRWDATRTPCYGRTVRGMFSINQALVNEVIVRTLTFSSSETHGWFRLLLIK